MEVRLGKGLAFLREPGRFVADEVHILGELEHVLRHAGRKIAIMRGWQINGSERQRHRIAFNGDGGGGLVLQGGNGVMLMGFGCPAWPRTCDAQDHRHDESNHASSGLDRKSTRLNSSHDQISYAVFCLKKKKKRASN